jgi:hypothetical protein
VAPSDRVVVLMDDEMMSVRLTVAVVELGVV